MRIHKFIKYTAIASAFTVFTATPVHAVVDITNDGFDIVEDFAGNEYGGADLIMPGANIFECPELILYNKIILVGDSRTHHLEPHINDSRIKIIAKSGQGLTWFKSAGVSELNRCLASEDYTTPYPKAIVFNLGVNDLTKIDEYISYMNQLAPKLINQNCTLYYMSVNPVDNTIIDNRRPDSQINAFNQALKTKLPDFTYINCYDYLKKTGFVTTDGLHYNSLTYRKIFEYEVNKVNERQPATKNVRWEKRGLYWYAYNPTTNTQYVNRWITYEGGKFYLDKNGRLKTNSWITTTTGNRYYVGATGRYYTNQWVSSGGKNYYLQSNGTMAKNQWIDNRYVGADGAEI